LFVSYFRGYGSNAFTRGIKENDKNMDTTENIAILLQVISCSSKNHPIPLEIISQDTGFSKLKTLHLILKAITMGNPVKLTDKGFYCEPVEE